MAAQLNKIAYVTGASRGIGQALVTALIDAGYFVVGMSRTTCARQTNFDFVQLDLNDLEAVKSFTFDKKATDVLLVNNAGIVGEIGPVGQITNNALQQVMTVNTLAPQILVNNFLKTYQTSVNSGHILNISSGAGKSAIDAWAAYCASKAALDLFSQTIHLEFELRQQKNWHIHSVAPGVVDTAMQTEIRQAKPEAFLALDRFIALNENKELASTDSVSKKLIQVVQDPQSFPNPIISVRNF